MATGVAVRYKYRERCNGMLLVCANAVVHAEDKATQVARRGISALAEATRGLNV
jgi:hypothetical protein